MGLSSNSEPFWTDTHQSKLEKTSVIVSGQQRTSIWEAFQAGDALFEGKRRHVCLILARRNLETVCAYLGALRSGVVPLFINGETPIKSIERFIEDFSPRYIFSSEPVSKLGYEPVDTLGGAQLYEASIPVDAEILPELAILQPTSGSTGDSKCVRVSYRNLDFVTGSIVSYLHLNPNRVLLSTLPFHYTFGLSILHTAIFSGADIVLTEESITSGNFWRIFADNRVTDFSGVPFQYQALSNRGFPASALKSLKFLSQAGGPLPVSEVHWWLDYCEPKAIDFFVMYGQTEASPRISYLPPAMARKKIGSVGVPIPGGSVEISKPDSNGIGEILYSGPNVCLGYAVSIQDLASSDELLGKLFTGDLGRLDEDGYIFLNGRSKRFVKLAGTSVGMDSMENAIKENLNLDVAVVGRDDKLVIVVQRAYDIDTAAQILELIDASTNLMKVEFVDELPRLDTGKLDYQFLSASYV